MTRHDPMSHQYNSYGLTLQDLTPIMTDPNYDPNYARPDPFISSWKRGSTSEMKKGSSAKKVGLAVQPFMG
jgi:hypothetical protein